MRTFSGAVKPPGFGSGKSEGKVLERSWRGFGKVLEGSERSWRVLTPPRRNHALVGSRGPIPTTSGTGPGCSALISNTDGVEEVQHSPTGPEVTSTPVRGTAEARSTAGSGPEAGGGAEPGQAGPGRGSWGRRRQAGHGNVRVCARPRDGVRAGASQSEEGSGGHAPPPPSCSGGQRSHSAREKSDGIPTSVRDVCGGGVLSVTS